MAGLIFIGYGVGLMLGTDGLANIATKGHNWMMELAIAQTLVLIAGITHHIYNNRHN